MGARKYPLYRIVSYMFQFVAIFSDINISADSVETRLRCGGIFYYLFARNCLLSLLMKDFENRSAFGKVRDKNIMAPFSGRGLL